MASVDTPVAAPTVAVLSDNETVKNIIATTRSQTPDEALLSQKYLGEFVEFLLKGSKVVPEDVETSINNWIEEIDKVVSLQLDEILHDPKFQSLEATWRGLNYLVANSETGTDLKIRVLNVTQDELRADLVKNLDFDQSVLFQKVYEEEYGQLGGEPFGLLVGDLEFSRNQGSRDLMYGRRPADIELLKRISQVAAMAHAPFLAAASPGLFNMVEFTEMGLPHDLAKIFEADDYIPWNSFRQSEESRYVALALPRVLARLPYGEKYTQVEEFDYEEDVDGTDHTKYLWMNAAWTYAAKVTDAYAKYGWMARVRGVETGGKVSDLPIHTFPTDDGDKAMKCPTEVSISDRREFELSNLGFLPLIYKKGTNYAVFMGAQSCQKPKVYFEPAASSNAELSAKFNLMLCTSRFAHFLKVMARDRIGSFMELSDCSQWLNRWIINYCVNPNGAGDRVKAERPLSDANIVVQEVEGKPGWFEAVAMLRPHFQFEALSTSLRLVAEVPKMS